MYNTNKTNDENNENYIQNPNFKENNFNNYNNFSNQNQNKINMLITSNNFNNINNTGFQSNNNFNGENKNVNFKSPILEGGKDLTQNEKENNNIKTGKENENNLTDLNTLNHSNFNKLNALDGGLLSSKSKNNTYNLDINKKMCNTNENPLLNSATFNLAKNNISTGNKIMNDQEGGKAINTTENLSNDHLKLSQQKKMQVKNISTSIDNNNITNQYQSTNNSVNKFSNDMFLKKIKTKELNDNIQEANEELESKDKNKD